MIRCDKLVFGYPRSDFRLAVDELSIAAGESVGLVGPSGSGKTTLLDMIAGVRTPEQGRVTVGDQIVSDLSDSARRSFRLKNIGLVFQGFELFGHLTARENILFPLAVTGMLRPEVEAELKRLIDKVGLAGQLDRRAERLSRGEQQRVALCRALVHRPPVLLADEPTGNLDPGNKVTALRLLIESAADRHATLLVATHDESLLPMLDRVVDLREISRAC